MEIKIEVVEVAQIICIVSYTLVQELHKGTS